MKLFMRVVVLVIVSTFACSVYAQKVLRIGMIASLSGPMAPEFKEMLATVEPTKEIINNRGIQIKGEKYKIEVVVEDDKSSPEGAVAAANKLIGKGIKFMVAPLFLPSGMAIASMCEKEKILRMVPICINPSAVAGPTKGRYCFFSNTTGIPNIRATYKYLKQRYPGLKKIAILIIDDPGVIIGKEWEMEEIKKQGMEVVFDAAYPIPTHDFYPILTKLLATKPDAIAGCVSAVAFAGAIVNQARELGFKGPIYWSCGAGDINVINDMIKPPYRHDVVNGLPDVLSENMPPMVKQLRELMEKRGMVLRYTGALTLECVHNLVKGIEVAQSIQVEDVVRAFEKMERMDTIWGQATLRGEEFGILPKRMILAPRILSKIENGKVETWFAE